MSHRGSMPHGDYHDHNTTIRWVFECDTQFFTHRELSTPFLHSPRILDFNFFHKLNSQTISLGSRVA
jgi:hypothetical protein